MAKLSYYMGKRNEDMSREELVFALENMADMVEQQRKDYLRELDMLNRCQRTKTWIERLVGL